MRLYSLLFVLALMPFASQAADAPQPQVTDKQVVADYAKLVHAAYKDAHAAARALQKAVDALLAKPSAATLAEARRAWLAARDPYSLTEAFRFYDGPIDFADDKTGQEGPEARLNAWPLNEAYIDYVQGNPGAGIVNDSAAPITKEFLKKKNQADDEADVATGYHAVEFLLWGQDVSATGPGDRGFQDYVPGKPANERRREYLKYVTELLADDLKFLVISWEPGKTNYAKSFTEADPKQSLGKMLTGMATLSGFELASERMGTALDSGDQEDEHSCFSDNTHSDLIANARGVADVYFARRGAFKGASLYKLIKQQDYELAEALEDRIKETESLMRAIPHPIDREVLASPAGSPGRQAMERAVASLQAQADLLKKAGGVLGVEVKVAAE